MNDILSGSIIGHAAAFRRREYSSVELTKAFLQRIDETDGHIGAYLWTDAEESLRMAERADKLMSSSEDVPLLCGIPISLKDNICTRSFPTTCASKMLEGYVPPYDAAVAESLTELGCVLLGKTNMDEFAMGSGCEKSAYKVTRNPADLSCSPGGSSGGATASVAADECVCALGSDTGGSVRQPAALCGVVGMKPTYGAVSRMGLIAFASSLDQIGCITKNVRDNAVLLSAISKADRRDATCRGIDDDLIRNIDSGVRGLRIGVVRELFGSEVCDDVRAAVEGALEIWKGSGAIIKSASLPGIKWALGAYHVIADAEASSNLARYDGVRFGHRTAESVASIDELYTKSRSEGFGKEVKLRLMMGTYVLSEGSRGKYYEKAQAARRMIRRDFSAAFEDCDILISPMTFNGAPKLSEYSDDPTEMYKSDVCGLGASLAGLPAISVPCGVDRNGLPVGIQIMGREFSEALLYTAANNLEKGRSGI